MTLIITDRPLEEVFQHIPPAKEPVIDIVQRLWDGTEIRTRSDLWNPREYREWLVCGPVKMQRWSGSCTPGADRTLSKLNRLLPGTDTEWSVYITDGSSPPNTMEQMLLVFRYLSGIGDTICLYREAHLEFLGPETPVARIDISGKPEGSTILRLFMNDVLYLFHDSGGGAVHDTGILDRTDPLHKRFGSFHAPQDGLTLRGLREALGNSCAVVTVYGCLDATTAADRLRFKSYTDAHPRYARPLGIVARDRGSTDTLIEYGVDEPIETGDCAFDDLPVRLYMLIDPGREHVESACIRGIRSIYDMMSAVAIVDNGDRRRPVPEIEFKYQFISDDGLDTHHLHTWISPDAVYGELYAYEKSMDDLILRVELVASHETGAILKLKACIDSIGAYHEWSSETGMDDTMHIWCVDRMGTACGSDPWDAENKVLGLILDEATGIQDGSLAEILEDFVPLIALKRILTRASGRLADEEGFASFIDGLLDGYDRDEADRFIQGLMDRMDVDLKGCVFLPDGKGGGSLRVARRFGGKG